MKLDSFVADWDAVFPMNGNGIIYRIKRLSNTLTQITQLKNLVFIPILSGTKLSAVVYMSITDSRRRHVLSYNK